MSELERRDALTYESIVSNRYVFWYDPKKMENFDKHYSVNDAFCAWGKLGLVAFLVHAHLKSSAFSFRAFPRRDVERARTIDVEVRRQTEEWLIKNSFPQAIVETYGHVKG
jgi:hypothetical protein